MIESQNIEYKTNWRDEYLKWICGFANAEGGKIFIGKNDDGSIIGLMNANELLELIPNKVRDVLGIMVDVNLHLEDGKYYIEIEVDPYPYPVNFKGQYHYRSGSTKQELKGHALNRFLLEKVGKRWDSVPVPDISLIDLKESSIDRAYDLIKTKYTTYAIEYSETSRLEHSPFPEKAIREALHMLSLIKIILMPLQFKSASILIILFSGIQGDYQTNGQPVT